MNGSVGPQIDWNTAEVEGAKLSVALHGETFRNFGSAADSE